jgi:uncharacterized protein (TIGR03435 family)
MPNRNVSASLILAFTLPVVHAASQQPAPNGPRFDVVSIRRNTSGSGSMTVGGQRGRFMAVNTTVLTLIMNAYPFETFRVIGAPGWATSERYDVSALVEGEPDLQQRQAMLQRLLADRFNLAAHTETRPMQTYALVLARSDGRLGPQLKPWTVDCDALRKSASAAPPSPRTGADFAIVVPCGMRGSRGAYAAGGYPIDAFARSLSSELSAPVTDRTGLKGDFEILLRWNPDPSLPGADPALPSLFTAVEEQLGLKLEPRREPAEVLVIDRIERPTPD